MKKSYDFSCSKESRMIRFRNVLIIMISLILLVGTYFAYELFNFTEEIAKYGFMYETSELNSNEIYITGVINNENCVDGNFLVFPEYLFDKKVVGIKISSSSNNFYIDSSVNSSKIEKIYIPGTYYYVNDNTIENFYNVKELEIAYGNTEIKKGALSNFKSLKKILLPLSSGSSFKDLFGNNVPKSLKTVNLYDEDTIIPEYYFYECENIENIILGNSVEMIGVSAFSYCESLKSIEFPNTLSQICSYAFYNCKSLNNVKCNDGLNYIGSSAFEKCTSLNNISLSSTIKEIGGSTFSGCTSLKKIIIPDETTKISEKMFYNCSSLENVVLGENNITIGNNAFEKCEKLVNIHFNEKIENIEANAFSGCTSLVQLEIPSSIKKLSEGSLSGLSQLKSLSLPFVGTSSSSKETVGIVFGSVSYSNSIKVTQVDSSYYYFPTTLTKVTIRSGNINDYSFKNCANITTIVLEDIKEIGFSAFANCSKLTSITLPNTLKTISNGAFANCYSMTSIKLPSDLTEISDNMFEGCEKLNSVSLGNKITSINDSAFENCKNIKKIYIPSSVKNINYSAFKGCTSLTSITLPSNLTEIGGYAFANCTNLSEINFNSNITNIGSYAFSKCESLKSLSLPKSLKKISNNAFEGCSSLNSLTMKDGLNSIGEFAFKDCLKLSSVIIPSSVSTLGNGVFYNDSKLIVYCEAKEKPSGWNTKWQTSVSHTYWDVSENSYYSDNNFEYIILNNEAVVTKFLVNYVNITIPNVINISDQTYKVTKVGEGVFEDKTNLQEITFSSNIKEIDNNAFSGCKGLKKITLPSNLEKIGNYAFEDCTRLTSISVPSTVQSIGLGAFSGCYNLSDLTLPFIGETKSSAYERNAVFGYCFGDEEFINSVEVVQYYNDNETITYYIPKALVNVKISGGNVKYGAFSNCSTIEKITLDTSCSKIEDYGFYNCKSLTSFSLPYNLKSIGLNAFENCTAMQNIVFNSYTTKIDNYAFKNCSSLKDVILPNSILNLGHSIFSGCDKLESLTLTFIDDSDSLSSTSRTLGYYFGNESYNNSYSIYQYDSVNSTGVKYYLPIGLTEVKVLKGYVNYGAFSNCSYLTDIYLGPNVTYSGNALTGCSNLENLTLPYLTDKTTTSASSKTVLGYIFGGTSYTGSTKTEQFYNSNNSVAYYIPTKLKTVTVLNGDILYGAFYNCKYLTQITISSDQQSYIDSYAFSKCVSLKELEISDYVSSIGESILYDCYNIEKLTVPYIGKSIKDINSKTSVLGYFFGENQYSSSNLTSQYYSENNSINYYIPSSLTYVNVLGGTISYGAFSNCTKLQNVLLRKDIEKIEENAFSGTNLTKLTLAFEAKQDNWSEKWDNGITDKNIIVWGN